MYLTVQLSLKLYFLIENISNCINSENFKLILLNKNHGKGYAIRQGLKELEGEYVLFIDSDLEYEPKDGFEIFQIAKQNKSIDVLYGSRYLGGKIQLRKHFFI